MAPSKGTSKSSGGKATSTKGDANTSSRTGPTADPRFANIATDPRFRLPSRKQQKVQLDSRFRRLLTDDEFAQKSTVDRYGRRLDGKSGRRALERFYRMDEEELDSDKDSEEEDEQEKSLAHRKTYDPARQGGFEESSSDDSDSSGSSEEDSDLSDEDADEGELDVDEEALARQTAGDEARGEIPEGEVTTRLAAVNMDWDNVRAVDLMVVAQSFCPVGGRLLSCAVYPSEFGRERMEREEMEGPPKELFTGQNKKKKKRRKGDDESESEDEAAMDARIRKELVQGATEESTEIDSRALRAYQLSRLRYYYAVMTFDSNDTAHAVYQAMDGREYLSSANFFDLRFIPDDTSFDSDRPRDECSRVPNGYRPSDFVTEALTHSKVKLTWDADDVERKQVQKRAFGRHEIDENDLKAYVGSDSSSDESENDKPTVEVVDGETGNTETEPKMSKAEKARRKMRLALGLPVDEVPSKGSKSNKSGEAVTGDMQITFSAGLTSDKAGSKSKNGVFENSLEDVREETTLEKYRRKEKERKARRKDKAKAAREGVEVAAAPTEEDGLSSPSEAEDEIVLDETEAAADDEEDPFNDPFFADPAAANAAARKANKAAKRKAAEEAAALESEARAEEKAQLERLMASDRAENGVTSAEHFDMAAIRKAEKAGDKKKGKWAKKKEKRSAKGEAAEEDVGLQRDFELDTADPRFQGLFDSHEFAIDPSNPRFSNTKAMKKLLDEGRRKRKDSGEDREVVSKPAASEGQGELEELVRKAKKRKT